MNRSVGLHLRITSTLEELFARANHLALSAVQFFFVQQETGLFYRVSGREVILIKQLQQVKQIKAFVHASFWVNLADAQRMVHPLLNRDIEQALSLKINTIVVHPGSFKGVKTKRLALDHMVSVLEDVFRRYPEIIILLENVSHEGKTIGGAIDDLGYIARRFPDRSQLGFCIDTSHAHAWGYDIVSQAGQSAFLSLVTREIGWHRVHLLHLNDTIKERGSHVDVHATPGHGVIGWDALIAFATDPLVCRVPIIIEAPDADLQEQERLVKIVKSRL